jgi:hypothetical protein
MNGFGLEVLRIPSQKQFLILRSVCVYIYIPFKNLDKKKLH